jgi:uncharacterized protein YjbJ (UPF0337 family)
MNKDIVKGFWKEIEGRLKQHWGEITDDEIAKMNGSYEELEGYLQKKYGYDQDRAKNEIHSFLYKYGWEKDRTKE